MYRRPLRFDEGETLIACSICGFPRRFPSELRYMDDKQFYCELHCEYHNGVTAQADAKRTADAQRRRDQENAPLQGPSVSWR
jgi:hypothetical protein